MNKQIFSSAAGKISAKGVLIMLLLLGVLAGGGLAVAWWYQQRTPKPVRDAPAAPVRAPERAPQPDDDGEIKVYPGEPYRPVGTG